MPDIRDYPDLQGLQDWVVNNFRAIKQFGINEMDEPEDIISKLEIQELIIYGEYGRGTTRTGRFPLQVIVVMDVDGEKTSTSTPFIDFSKSITSLMENMNLSEDIPNFEQPNEEMEQYFNGYDFNRTPSDDITGGVNRWVPIRSNEDSAMAYSLTYDQNIIVERSGITREPAGAQVSESVTEEVNTSDSDIAEYPEKAPLEEHIIQSFNRSKQESISEFPNREEDINDMVISNIVIAGEWGNGDAEFGVDSLMVDIFVGLRGYRSISSVPIVSRILRTITEQMNSGFDPDDMLKEWTGGVTFRLFQSDDYESRVEADINNPDTGTVYNLTQRKKYHLVPRETVGYNVEPVEQGENKNQQPSKQEQKEQQPVQQEQPEEQVIPEESLAQAYPEIPPELRPFAIEQDEIEVPINKDSKRVKPRPLYEFEMELMTPGDAGTSISRQINDGIGFYIQSGQYGIMAPPPTFPRVGSYIKYHLLYQGPSYINQMYNDLVIYSAYLTSSYGSTFKVMTYGSFREYIHRLKLLGDKNITPQLIRPLSQQQAAAKGLTSIATLPSGIQAPWLERKHYYEVIEDNIDNPAWDNPSKALYEEDK